MCANISDAEYDHLLTHDSFEWKCPICDLSTLTDESILSQCSSRDTHSESPGTHPPRFTNRQCHKPQNKLKIITINVNGLKGVDKKAAFHVFIDTEQPDVILGQESKLDSAHSNSEIFPPGYNKNVFRKDRDAHGGGVFIAARDELDVAEISVCRECPLLLVKLRVIGRPPPTYRFFLSASREQTG